MSSAVGLLTTAWLWASRVIKPSASRRLNASRRGTLLILSSPLSLSSESLSPGTSFPAKIALMLLRLTPVDQFGQG